MKDASIILFLVLFVVVMLLLVSVPFGMYRDVMSGTPPAAVQPPF